MSVKSKRQQSLEDKWVSVLQGSPSTEEFRRAYDCKHQLFMEEGIDNLSKTKLDGLYQMIVARVGTGKVVLEIGPGHGEMSFALARQGNAVVGVDISAVVLERLRAKLAQEPGLNLRFEQGDARDLNFDDGSFDYGVSTNLVEHLSAADGRRHLREVWRVLKSNGCYLFFAPSRIYSGYRSAGFHLHMYSLWEAIELASSLGFRARWIEPKFRRLGIKGEIPSAMTWMFLWYERGLERLKRAFPHLPLAIRGYRIVPTVMVAAHKVGGSELGGARQVMVMTGC